MGLARGRSLEYRKPPLAGAVLARAGRLAQG